MTNESPSSSEQARNSSSTLFSHLDINIDQDNQLLEKRSAIERTEWAVAKLSPHLVLSSSFGAQAAVSLHMATQVWSQIPVVLIDTGYLFKETYEFIDQLTERLKLNLKIYLPAVSPAWTEARYGKLWEQGVDGITKYNQIHKVEPMNRALEELDAWGWLAGLRRQQSSTRKNLHVLAVQNRRLKIHPIIDWTDRDIYQYLTQHQLPYHPLWDQGYVSIGDTHTTSRLEEGMTEEQTRFFGLKRECGLHEPNKDS